MRREPFNLSTHWLDKEKRRGTVIRRRCWICGRKVWIPQHLWGVQRYCEDCETDEEVARCAVAATEWRRLHTLSPLIEDELDAGDD